MAGWGDRACAVCQASVDQIDARAQGPRSGQSLGAMRERCGRHAAAANRRAARVAPLGARRAAYPPAAPGVLNALR